MFSYCYAESFFSNAVQCSIKSFKVTCLLMTVLKRLFFCSSSLLALRKHAYSNILKILPPKNENFQKKISDIFHISAQNIDCEYSLEPPRRGGSNEYLDLCF